MAAPCPCYVISVVISQLPKLSMQGALAEPCKVPRPTGNGGGGLGPEAGPGGTSRRMEHDRPAPLLL